MMKKSMILLLALLMLAAGAWAEEEETPLPQSVRKLCEEIHPGYAVAAHDGWGSEQAGQFALVLKRGEDNVLCFAEKAQEDEAYRLTIDNTNAIYDGDELPSLLIDTGGDVLFYGYDDGIDAVHYHTEKQSGQWQAMDVTAYENLNGGYRSIQSGVMDGYLYYDENAEDENGNILHGFSYAPILVSEAFESAMEPQNFDINLYDADPVYGLFQTSRMPGVAEKWLRDGEELVAVDLKRDHVIMLLEQENGKKRLRIASLVDGLYQIEESGALPSDMGMDAFHAGEDELYLTRAGGMLQYGFERQQDGLWRMTYMDAEERIILPFGGVCALEASALKRNNGIYYGTHPWNDLMEIDFEALPHTVGQAVEMMDQSAYALVHNPNPNDRLHLRTAPDKNAASLGKFYNRTPVYIIERGKAWTHVRIGSEEQGMTGYMMTKFLAFDEEEKEKLACAFPQKHLLDGHAENGVAMYRQTNANGRTDERFENNYGDFIIGVSGDAWFVVLRADGAVGYVPQDYFWDGNG